MKLKFLLPIVILIVIIFVAVLWQPITSPSSSLPSLSVYGKLVDFSQTNGLNVFEIQPEIVDWELNNKYLKVEVKSDPTGAEIIKGNNYVFYFAKLSEKEGSWDRVMVSEDLTTYKQEGKNYHSDDLARDQLTVMDDGRVIPTNIITNESTELEVLLINKQDNDVQYKIKNAKIVNEEASQFYGYWWQLPPYEERLRNAIISECSVDFDSSEHTISAGSTQTLAFLVNCPNGVNTVKTYEMCDNFEERRNCRTETSRSNNLMLWGEIEFTDELGNKHVFSQEGVIKQHLNISKATSLEVNYSNEASSKDEFYIHVSYKDGEGNEIEDAQVNVQFNNLGATEIFIMRYDSALNRYKFLWPDFVEWDPGYKKGIFEFTLTAEKQGYAIQRKTYMFTLK